MPIKRIKDTSKIVAKRNLTIGKYYFHVFLWEDQESLYKNTIDSTAHSTFACVNYTDIVKFKYTFSPKQLKLGEIHFIYNLWSTEIIAHELCHILLHRLRILYPKGRDIMLSFENLIAEEDVCYEFGYWFYKIYNWLLEVNP